MPTGPAVLMCPPRFFDIQYVINPWMEGNLHQASYPLALEQWKRLHAVISEQVDVLLIEPEAALPDMVFTANGGLIHNGIAAVSRFAHPERRREEKHFEAWFKVEGFEVSLSPPDVSFEGEGDALFTPDRGRLWLGNGWRTDVRSAPWLQSLWPSVEIVPLRLVDPRFYHLDTCFCPLANGDVLYYLPAFNEPSRALIEQFYPADKRIAVDEADALHFACNAVNLERHIVVNQISPALHTTLKTRGFTVTQNPLMEFLKAGGAAKCLVLKLA